MKSIRVITVATTVAAMVSCFPSQNSFAQEDISDALAAVVAVDINGQGHERAVAAMEKLNQVSPSQIPELLRAMNGANKISQNWLRGAIQSALRNEGKLPAGEIEAYFQDSTGSDLGRLLAFEILSGINQENAKTIIPKLVDDPSLPLKRMAIDYHIEQANAAEENGEISKAVGELGFALTRARDLDQIDSIANTLERLGVSVDLRTQLGFIQSWHVVAPFDNTDESGFDKPLGPELNPKEIDLESTYADSKSGEEIQWQVANSADRQSVVDLNEVFGNEKFATAYAYAEFQSDKDQTVNIRIGCINGNKVWVNGELIISNEIYHVGMQPDQFMGKAKLVAGTNKILFKVCQKDQKQPWAQDWQFQLRICDDSGQAIKQAEPEEQE